VGLGRFDPAGFEAAPIQEPGDALDSGVGQQIGGAGKVAIDRKVWGKPDGGSRHGGKI
jgi:hypothetical protein